MKFQKQFKILFKHWVKKAIIGVKNTVQFIVSLWIKTTNHIRHVVRSILEWLQFIIEILYRTLHHPVFYSLTISIATVFIYRVISPLFQGQNHMSTDSDTMQKFIEWAGILYSLLVSMILIRSWERLDETGNLLAKEAYALSNLFDSVQSIPATVTTESISGAIKITQLVKDYIKHVEKQYEVEYSDIDRELIGNRKIELIKQEIEKISMHTPELFRTDLNQKLDALILARKNRLINSKIHMPFLIWVLLAVSSLLWLSLFISVGFKNIWLGYLFVGGLTFLVITITVTVFFFYEPVNIKWNDTSGSWKDLKSKSRSN